MAKKNKKKIIGILLNIFLGIVLLSLVITVPFMWIAPPTSSFIIQAELSSEPDAPREIKHEWVSWEEISSHMPIAVVASEDQNFPSHFGFDFEAISKAIKESGKRQRGASTITQQLVKNLYLWPSKSFIRKGIEAYLTVLVELFWSKQRILEVYLNFAEFGRGVYGVEAAARTYFKKSAANLTLHESALLAAVLPSPRRRSVVNPSDHVNRRAEWIERQIKQLGGKNYLK